MMSNEKTLEPISSCINNTNPNNQALELLKNLSESERELTLKILKEYSQEGSSQTFQSLKYEDFEEIPVDIDTFLDDDKYLGRGIWAVDNLTGEKRCTLFPYWRETLHKLFPDSLSTAYNTLILTGAIGLGKAQPLSATVLTDSGFKPMGSLTLEDKVYGEDGRLHNIIGIFPQGKKKICKITFSDKTSTTCCDEHLWTVYDSSNHMRCKTLETKEIIKKGIKKTNSTANRFKIPVTAPIEYDTKAITIPPYTLGVLIGDGALSKKSISFTSNDIEIVNAVNNECLEGYEVHYYSNFQYSICKSKDNHSKANLYNKYIKDLGLNITSEAKFIPQNYLLNDINTRIEVLQGLMDTDGTISKNGSTIEYYTVSSRLKDDFITLVQSLGGTCSVREKHPTFIDSKGNKKNGLLCYVIRIKLPKNINPFKLHRKLKRINPNTTEPARYITNIEYIGEDDCQCIYIDSKNHLYLTNDFIVTHNTLMGVLAMLYLLYRMLCLKDPYSYYGLMPSDKITFSMLNITLDAARGVGWDKLQQLIQGSEWFMEHGTMNASRSNPQWQPPKGIELICGSNNRHVVGRALFSNITDEVNFGVGNDVEKKKQKQKKMIAQIDARMKSRFMKGTYLPTLNIIISSKDTEQAFLDSYINTKKQNESKTTLIIDEPQWVVRNDKGSPNDPGSFYVAIGNKFLAHELLPVNFPLEQVEKYREKGYTLLRIPPGFRSDFEDNLDQALMDIAGLSSSSSTKYISGVRLNQTKTDTYLNPFTKDIIEVGNDPNDKAQYNSFFDLARVNPSDMTKPMFIHLDMSLSGDKTGIAGVWITGKRPTQEGEESSRELQYKLAFSVSIKAPKGYQVSFEKNRSFIRWLRDVGFNIKKISSDTFQSAQIQQELKTDGFDTKILSVDRVNGTDKSQDGKNSTKICLPYHYLKTAIYERRVEIYQYCPLLTDELIGLVRKSDGHIDHTPDGINSKDQADAFCGALFLASEFADEYSYTYGDNIDVTLDINGALSDDLNKRQMIADFEKELLNSSPFLANETTNAENEKLKEDYKTFADIMDGIIII